MNMKQLTLYHARIAEYLTWRHWEEWKDSPVVGSRKLALKAKCHGIVAFDRVLRQGDSK